ncbi:MAG: ABC-ATPase domain-containing protein [Gemmatimonadota bacterium]
MKTLDDLTRLLHHIDGRGYPAYKEIRGRWEYPDFHLGVDHVQGDPFAAPSRLRLILPPSTAGLEPWILERASRRVGAAAWIARRAAKDIRRLAPGRGSGKSGQLAVATPGQLVLPQTAVRISPSGEMEVRLTLGLPARGRRVMGREAARLFSEVLPGVVSDLLAPNAWSPGELRTAAAANEDAEALRDRLPDHGLVAFVADGAILPRRSGVDDRPLESGAVAFRSPEGLRVTLDTPNAGPVCGMGIPEGVTLIVGGGFHGKSTLLRALEAGVFNHRPGDGREQVVARRDAVKLRAEDGRSVRAVDISPFIGDLPGGQGTKRFSTGNASGSTSQAAGLVEALEVGARLLLMDEDTAATNFLIRDRRMQLLVPPEREPIVPLVDRIRDLYQALGVSAVLVLGGSGDYLDVADTVVGMVEFEPEELTERAREVAQERPTGRVPETGPPLAPPRPRRIRTGSFPEGRGGRGLRVRTLDAHRVRVGDRILDLSGVEQLLLPTQLRTVAAAFESLAREGRVGDEPLGALVEHLEAELTRDLDRVDPRGTGDLAWVRRFELAAALNRLRGLEVTE